LAERCHTFSSLCRHLEHTFLDLANSSTANCRLALFMQGLSVCVMEEEGAEDEEAVRTRQPRGQRSREDGEVVRNEEAARTQSLQELRARRDVGVRED
jgi:hypothetical protein